MEFRDLQIIEPILQALREQGYSSPTPIQAKAIPPLLAGRDLLGCAQTGTGKTAAFAVPILQRLHAERPVPRGPRPIRALVLTPTRELAAQIGQSFSDYGTHLGLKNLVIFGGVSQNPQTAALKAGVDILVATPGRLIDLLNQGFVRLDGITCFVLDEADRMLDMGFIRDVERIIAKLPPVRHTMLFSATMPKEIDALASRLLRDPARVSVSPPAATAEHIAQSVCFVAKADKTKLLLHMLREPAVDSALVFSRTKHGANKIAKDLLRAGVSCEVIHANKAQNARLLALDRFKTRQSRVMVATDIVSRGIDITELSHVFNYNLPEVPEAYVHRIGRTGRAGLGGTAVSFCDETEVKLLRDIEKTIGSRIPVIRDHPYEMGGEPVGSAPKAPLAAAKAAPARSAAPGKQGAAPVLPIGGPVTPVPKKRRRRRRRRPSGPPADSAGM